MEFLNVLSREEMKNVKGGRISCHKCCWKHNTSSCSACAVGSSCVSGAVAVPCSPCNTVLI